MVDFNKIPYHLYKELVNMMGKEEAEKYIKKENHNFEAVNLKILRLKIKAEIKKRPILFLIIFFIIILLLVFYFLDMFLVI